MKVQILSDLHADYCWPKQIKIADDVDVVIAAGDISQGAVQSCVLLRDIVPARVAIVMVLGNHEYYHSNLADELADARRRAPDFNVHLLENDATIIHGVRFLGATLWTDYDCFGAERRAEAMAACGNALNDHRLIGLIKTSSETFTPAHALKLHRRSRSFFAGAMAERFEGPTVVVTHHGPHWKSVAPRYRRDLVTAGFVSDCEDLILATRPVLWVHGHTHNSANYLVGSTRVIANPHGYANENREFNAALVVEVGHAR